MKLDTLSIAATVMIASHACTRVQPSLPFVALPVINISVHASVPIYVECIYSCEELLY